MNYSSIDLKTCGVHRYVEAPNFELLLFRFAFDDDPVTVIDLMDFQAIPKDVLDALRSDVTKRPSTLLLSGRRSPGTSVSLTIRCNGNVRRSVPSRSGYRTTLEGVAEMLKFEAQKGVKGKALIKYETRKV